MLLLGHIVQALAADFQAELAGPADLPIHALAPLETAGPGELSFLSHPKYQSKLAASRAGCVIVSPAMQTAALSRGPAIIVNDPYLYFARVTQFWKHRHGSRLPPGIHPTAFVDTQAQLDPTASVGAFAVIEAGAFVGAGVCVGAHSVVGQGAFIGADTTLAARVTVASGCRIGQRGLFHPGVVIGADGFGFAPDAGRWEKIEQLGSVRIGDDVEMGANTCVDRGALGDTLIGDGVKLDNLVQIGHNVQVGAHTAMAGCVGVAGSARIGERCSIGGGAIILGHLSLADGVHVSAASVVTRSITQPGLYTGLFPIDDNASWEKNAATLKQLHGLRDRLKRLEIRLPPTKHQNP